MRELQRAGEFALVCAFRLCLSARARLCSLQRALRCVRASVIAAGGGQAEQQAIKAQQEKVRKMRGGRSG
eukprot:1342757-Pleurochrysis_carterae.AAC.2